MLYSLYYTLYTQKASALPELTPLAGHVHPYDAKSDWLSRDYSVQQPLPMETCHHGTLRKWLGRDGTWHLPLGGLLPPQTCSAAVELAVGGDEQLPY